MRRLLFPLLFLLAALGAPAAAAPAAVPHVPVATAPLASLPAEVAAAAKDQAKTADTVRLVLILTLMTLLPAFIISSTSFVRIIVVLSMIRHAFGMPETPPNQVLISLALFLTAFSMMPALDAINDNALQPFMSGKLTVEQAIDKGTDPLRGFMLRQVRDQDIKAVYDISHKPLPARAADVGMLQLVPAFMFNELRVSFRIGFVIMLPFLLIDLIVSSILLALGMLMVPPSTLSLPIKLLMFVLIDGWSLILQGVLGSFR
ncbi:MAG TPA: flagellar type III secretion system pore protein FliP [Rhizomicrobium sp.]|nr:flagellar type III secretion system pore protein FliP [Rhizomicrobium sp.]